MSLETYVGSRGWVFDRINDEHQHQVTKHGGAENPGSWLEVVDRDDFKCLAVLTEEVGEVARDVIEKSRTWEELENELIQVATVCVAWVENIRRNSI